jgi:hypothetical protein
MWFRRCLERAHRETYATDHPKLILVACGKGATPIGIFRDRNM